MYLIKLHSILISVLTFEVFQIYNRNSRLEVIGFMHEKYTDCTLDGSVVFASIQCPLIN